eukprot:633905-Pyramimonas_sp.AAC.1
MPSPTRAPRATEAFSPRGAAGASHSDANPSLTHGRAATARHAAAHPAVLQGLDCSAGRSGELLL